MLDGNYVALAPDDNCILTPTKLDGQLVYQNSFFLMDIDTFEYKQVYLYNDDLSMYQPSVFIDTELHSTSALLISEVSPYKVSNYDVVAFDSVKIQNRVGLRGYFKYKFENDIISVDYIFKKDSKSGHLLIEFKTLKSEYRFLYLSLKDGDCYCRETHLPFVSFTYVDSPIVYDKSFERLRLYFSGFPALMVDLKLCRFDYHMVLQYPKYNLLSFAEVLMTL